MRTWDLSVGKKWILLINVLTATVALSLVTIEYFLLINYILICLTGRECKAVMKSSAQSDVPVSLITAVPQCYCRSLQV